MYVPQMEHTYICMCVYIVNLHTHLYIHDIVDGRGHAPRVVEGAGERGRLRPERVAAVRAPVYTLWLSWLCVCGGGVITLDGSTHVTDVHARSSKISDPNTHIPTHTHPTHKALNAPAPSPSGREGRSRSPSPLKDGAAGGSRRASWGSPGWRLLVICLVFGGGFDWVREGLDWVGWRRLGDTRAQVDIHIYRYMYTCMQCAYPPGAVSTEARGVQKVASCGQSLRTLR